MEDTNWERPCLKYKSSVPAGYEDGTVDCETCGNPHYQHKSWAAAMMGRVTSEKKAVSSRKNGKKGGRPVVPKKQ